jgi:hypothetical protein
MDKIKAQTNKLGEILLAPETGAAYTKTLTLTWTILRETGILVWLVICLAFVGTDWFWNNSIDLGRKARVWYNGLSEKAEDTATQPLGTTGQSLLEVGKSGTAYLLAQARKQLGLKEEVNGSVATPPKPAPVATAPTPAPVAAPTAVAEPPVPAVVPAAEVDADEV